MTGMQPFIIISPINRKAVKSHNHGFLLFNIIMIRFCYNVLFHIYFMAPKQFALLVFQPLLCEKLHWVFYSPFTSIMMICRCYVFRKCTKHVRKLWQKCACIVSPRRRRKRICIRIHFVNKVSRFSPGNANDQLSRVTH